MSKQIAPRANNIIRFKVSNIVVVDAYTIKGTTDHTPVEVQFTGYKVNREDLQRAKGLLTDLIGGRMIEVYTAGIFYTSDLVKGTLIEAGLAKHKDRLVRTPVPLEDHS